MNSDEILIGVKIKPVEVDGVEYCRYKGRRCPWFSIYDMCKWDDYSCELFDDVEGTDRVSDHDKRPLICEDATVACNQGKEQEKDNG